MPYATFPNAKLEEIRCGSALTRTMPHSGWSLNPYRASQQASVRGGVYGSQAHVAVPAERIVVKTNLVEVLRREVSRANWRCEHVTIGTAYDPYHPAEQQYGLTRGALDTLLHSGTPCSVITRSPDILRDLPILRELSQVAECSVLIGIATLREDVSRHIEPDTAGPARRLEVVARLAAAGIKCGVLLDPVIVGLTDGPENVQAVARAAHEHGATFEDGNTLPLAPDAKERLVAAARSASTERRKAEVTLTAPRELLEPWRMNRMPVHEVRHRGQLALAI